MTVSDGVSPVAQIEGEGTEPAWPPLNLPLELNGKCGIPLVKDEAVWNFGGYLVSKKAARKMTNLKVVEPYQHISLLLQMDTFIA